MKLNSQHHSKTLIDRGLVLFYMRCLISKQSRKAYTLEFDVYTYRFASIDRYMPYEDDQ
jgi:hypothetical protein